MLSSFRTSAALAPLWYSFKNMEEVWGDVKGMLDVVIDDA